MIDIKNIMDSVYRKYDLVYVPNYLSKKILFYSSVSLGLVSNLYSSVWWTYCRIPIAKFWLNFWFYLSF